jgi:hypothetical protein
MSVVTGVAGKEFKFKILMLILTKRAVSQHLARVPSLAYCPCIGCKTVQSM